MIKVSKEEIQQFILNLPDDVRNMLSDVEILDRIELLPPEIANGRILKMVIDDLLDKEDGIQSGLLYALEDGASIKPHEHADTEDGNMETYIALNGNIQMSNIQMSANICILGGKHWIKNMKKGDLIGTFKVRKDKTDDYFKEIKGSKR